MRESRMGLTCALAALPVFANPLTLEGVVPNKPMPTSEPGWIVLLGVVLVAVGAIARMRMTKRRSE